MQFYRANPMYGGDHVRSDYEEIAGKRRLVRLRFEIDQPIESIVNLTYYYAVERKRKDAIESRGLTGVRFSPCDVSPSDNFIALYPDLLPDFDDLEYFQLHPDGKPLIDDIALEGGELILSEPALSLMRPFDLGDMEIIPLNATGA